MKTKMKLKAKRKPKSTVKALKNFIKMPFKTIAFHVVAALFFLIPAFAAFISGFLSAFGLKETFAVLSFLVTWLLTVLGLANSALPKALEEDKRAQKRLAASVSFIAVSFPGNWLAGMVFSSLREEKSLEGLILGSIAALLYGIFLVIPYWVSASHLVGILLDMARKGGLLEDDAQEASKQKT